MSNKVDSIIDQLISEARRGRTQQKEFEFMTEGLNSIITQLLELEDELASAGVDTKAMIKVLQATTSLMHAFVVHITTEK